jgi:hypothetical protein
MKAKLASHNAISNGPVRKSITDRIRTDFGSDSEDSEFEVEENYNNANQLRKSKTTSNFDRSRIGSIKLSESVNNSNEKGIFYIKPVNKSSMTYSNMAFLNDINDDLAEEFNANNKTDSEVKVLKKSQVIFFFTFIFYIFHKF